MPTTLFANCRLSVRTCLLAGLLLVGTIGVMGCDDDDDDGVRVTTDTIIDVVRQSTSLTTLEAALAAAGLDTVLDNEGPFTLLAPTDEAFAALSDTTLDNLLADPEGDLTEILLYHVIAGTLSEDSLVELGTVETLAGEDVTVAVENGEVLINGTTMLTTSDVIVDNGVIHFIDGVLIPPSLQ